MNRISIRACLMLALGMLPVAASAVDIVLTGDTTSRITATVRAANRLLVTDDKGGWFDQGLAMQQLRGWESPYETQARLRIVSSSGAFQVRMDRPLEIRNTANAALVFRRPKVSLAAEDGEQKTLEVGLDVKFQNPFAPVAGEDSIGYYGLAISAYPPEGNFKETAGSYVGELSLVFEPSARIP
ncbi:hypothetical protein AXYL_01036 [Achromobacter xylosoxidans A8]|uniref:Fimbrial assembly protein n=1 Tax=Achromobacter xylosoxidans (strain A8) TaxID=762376 RepID=E3HJQ7_ACHXA|nr:hypothetical protein [Achromobacter xylosoxidans]ADP14382.1 hypothetical protein AXYL_01036 [Achromobacter xylosoxidans A8]